MAILLINSYVLPDKLSIYSTNYYSLFFNIYKDTYDMCLPFIFAFNIFSTDIPHELIFVHSDFIFSSF